MGLTVECEVHFKRGGAGRKRLREGPEPEPPPVEEGQVPRLSRLMALAVRFDRLVEAGHVENYAALARLGHVTRARLTQIMNLRLLAPVIQEEILFLPKVAGQRDAIAERHVRPIAAVPDWGEQRVMWEALKSSD
ncbi:MAG: hypothetical protein R6V58_04510 [Planctomycetota bacterium]